MKNNNQYEKHKQYKEYEEYEEYEEEILNYSLKQLEFKKIRMENIIETINSPIVYLSIAVAIFSLVVSLSKDFAVWSAIIGIGYSVALLILLIFNFKQCKKNKKIKWKVEIIKLRIENLKQEELNKKRNLELEEEKKNYKKLNNDINKINSFLGIK
ncbi:hypothetical protein ACV3X1_00455 [Clostridium perfringens]